MVDKSITDKLAFCLFFFLIFLSFAISRVAPVAHGGSQARGLIRAVAAGLHHSSRQRQILDPLSKDRVQTCNVMVPSRIR